MKVRMRLAAIALGATVLTTVPLAVLPGAAYACWGDETESQSGCEDYGGSLDPGNWQPDGAGGGEYFETVGDWGAAVTPVPSLPEIVVTATRLPPSVPEPPSNEWIATYTGGGGGGGPSNTAAVLGRGPKEEKREDCLRNATPSPVRLTQTFTYTVSYQVSAGVSAGAKDVLSATLGAQLNTSVTRTAGVDVLLSPGMSSALYVEYQTVTYVVFTPSMFGGVNREFVTVTQPTGIVTARAC
ncbi:DUF6426 family protein [Longispora urticae]